MSQAALGRFYADGEIVLEEDGVEVVLRTAGRNEVIGEMAIIDHQARSATIRAKGRVRILTLDKRNFLRRISEDPSLAFRMIETMSRRVRELSHEALELQTALREREAGPSAAISPRA